MSNHEFIATFPGGKRVDTRYGKHTICTDQTVEGGGEDSAPNPFVLFQTSLVACAGYYILGFLEQRNLPKDAVTLKARAVRDQQTGRLDRFEIEIEVTDAIPSKYHNALVRTAKGCTVKKTLEDPPEVTIKVV